MNVEDVSDEGSGMSQEHYRHIPRRCRGSLNWNECTVDRNLDFKNTAGGDPWSNEMHVICSCERRIVFTWLRKLSEIV